jgi:hypothetical protein
MIARVFFNNFAPQNFDYVNGKILEFYRADY